MNYELRTLLIICLLILLNIMVVSGCGSVYRTVKDTILGKPNTQEVIPDTLKGQLWQTIKGLTPNWMAIPVIALGAVAMFNGAAKLGMSCIIFGSVNLFMALATSRFGFWMALCGLVGSMLAVAASILAKNKALKEIVFGVQAVKDIIPETDNRLKDAKIILAKQVKSTKKIVAKIKSKAKLKGKIPCG